MDLPNRRVQKQGGIQVRCDCEVHSVWGSAALSFQFSPASSELALAPGGHNRWVAKTATAAPGPRICNATPYPRRKGVSVPEVHVQGLGSRVQPCTSDRGQVR